MMKMARHKTAAQLNKENQDRVRNLPTDIKRKFWKAMSEDGKNLSEARAIAGIDDIMVAAELVIQCHKQVSIMMPVEDVV